MFFLNVWRKLQSVGFS
ncbi:hypothetical protein OIU77_001839 [Salix suchowensis]|uniref:Uncharacterized protein n=1 Tax=Salix suchowensis TaxID=1278906 RepID=A0ABQ9B2T2_9ROSI|nr:hypothetical protein OIU77_001839 [Salix suchowensis]